MAGDQGCRGLARVFLDHAMLWRAADEVILAAVRFLGHRVLVGAISVDLHE